MYVVPVGICWLVVGKKEKPTVYGTRRYLSVGLLQIAYFQSFIYFRTDFEPVYGPSMTDFILIGFVSSLKMLTRRYEISGRTAFFDFLPHE